MNDRLRDIARKLLSMARDLGCDEAQAAVHFGRGSKIGFEKNDFNIATSHEETSCSIVVHKDRKKGAAATNDVSDDALRTAARNAIELSRFSVVDEHLCLPGPATPSSLDGRFDLELESPAMERMRGVAKTLIGEAKKDRRISIDSGGVDAAYGRRVVMNTRGLDVADRSTSIDWSLMGMGVDGSDVTSFDYSSGSSWRWDGAEAGAAATAAALAKKIVSGFGARKGEAYRGMVLLTPSSLGSLLLGPMHTQISGKMVVDAVSRWGNAVGEKVAADSLTIVDDPADLRLGGACPFDGEGVPTRRLAVIEGGVLKSHLDSTYTARRRGTAATGHSGFSLHGCAIASGKKSTGELLRIPPVMVQVSRFSGNVDPVSGNFSGVVKGGHLYRGGVYAHPLKETMIAGNFFEMLKNIAAVGAEVECYCNAFHAPSVLVDGISVSTG